MNEHRWFEDEAIELNELQDNYTEDDNDLYVDFLAGELLDDHTTDSIVPVYKPPLSIPVVVTDSLVEGLGSIFPSYRRIIIDCIQPVFNIDAPTECQILLVQVLVFLKNGINHRIMCICQTGDDKSLPIQCAATMRCYVTTVVVPLISIGADQASNICYLSNPEAGIYTEHLDSVRDKDDTQQMVSYLNGLTNATLHKISVILYISPSTITHHVWSTMITNLLSKQFVCLFCVDECHYINCIGRHFRPEFYKIIRYIVGMMWDKCPMLFCSATINRTSMYHILLMLCMESTIETMNDMPPDMGLDDTTVHIPTIDPLPTKFFNALIWGQVG